MDVLCMCTYIFSSEYENMKAMSLGGVCRVRWEARRGQKRNVMNLRCVCMYVFVCVCVCVRVCVGFGGRHAVVKKGT